MSTATVTAAHTGPIAAQAGLDPNAELVEHLVTAEVAG